VIAVSKADPERVYIGGISAGGAAAARVAAAYPEVYAALGVHSGIAPGSVTTLSAALAMMRTGVSAEVARETARPLPTIVFRGDQDGVVHPSNAGKFLSHLQRSTPRSVTSRAERGRSDGGREFTRTVYRQGAGIVLLEDWIVHGGGHAWSGGSAAGTYTDPSGPNASREMIRFFLAHKRISVGRGL
jgi:poly(3-hydroxybutyrate) depolymerase